MRPEWHTLLEARPWSQAELSTLEVRCKSALLKDWGLHVARRFGADEPNRLRALIGVTAVDLPDSPPADGWVPVRWQLALTRLICERHLGSDLLRLEPLLREDARRKPAGLVEKVIRLALTPQKILAQGGKIHASLYDRGSCEVRGGRDLMTLTWRGSRLFEEPTWRVLQVFAIRAMCAELNAPEPTLRPLSSPPEGFQLEVCFKR